MLMLLLHSEGADGGHTHTHIQAIADFHGFQFLTQQMLQWGRVGGISEALPRFNCPSPSSSHATASMIHEGEPIRLRWPVDVPQGGGDGV